MNDSKPIYRDDARLLPNLGPYIEASLVVCRFGGLRDGVLVERNMCSSIHYIEGARELIRSCLSPEEVWRRLEQQ